MFDLHVKALLERLAQLIFYDECFSVLRFENYKGQQQAINEMVSNHGGGRTQVRTEQAPEKNQRSPKIRSRSSRHGTARTAAESRLR